MIATSGDKSETESGLSSCPLSPTSSALASHSALTSSLYDYIQDLDHLKYRVFEEAHSQWLVALTVRQTKSINWSREPSNESTLDICRHILSSFNGINQNSPPLLSFDEDDDFIVFEDKTESSHDHDSTIEKDESIQLQKLILPIVFTLSISRTPERTTLSSVTSSARIVSSLDVKAELVVDVVDPSHYPSSTPLFSLELTNVPRHLAQKIHRLIESTAVQWSLGRLLEPSLKLIVCKLVRALDNLAVDGSQARFPQSVQTRQQPHRYRLLSEDDAKRHRLSISSSTVDSHSTINSDDDRLSDLQMPLWPVPQAPQPRRIPEYQSPRGRAFTTDSSTLHARKQSKENVIVSSCDVETSTWTSKERERLRESSRYLRDFEEISILGIGAFGCATKCRSRIFTDPKINRLNITAANSAETDSSESSTFFAIKRIPLIADSESQNLALQREASSLAVLHHPNIVRYYSAWIESSPSDHPGTIERKLLGSSRRSHSAQKMRNKRKDSIGHESNNIERSSRSIKYDYDKKFSSFMTFGYSQIKGCTTQNPTSQRRGRRDTISAIPEGSSTFHGNKWTDTWDETEPPISSGQSSITPKRYLFIQMEFCSGQTLRKAIDSGRLHDKPGLIWILFRQLLDGLSYMHNHGLIHRDLKPCNIFLDGELQRNESIHSTAASGSKHEPPPTSATDHQSVMPPNIHVKIGDFGLTTFVGSSFQGCPKTPLRTDPYRNNAAFLRSGVSVNLSAGVGTKFYMAPEQEAGGTYNHKADMFSLGVVFFELWYPPFKTAMERAIVLTNLIRNREFPTGFEQSVPPEVPDILRRLLSPSSADRPTAQSLLQSLLLPHVAPGEFQLVYDTISRHAFSAETSLIVSALFDRQLHHQLQESTHLEHRLLPYPERSSWKRNLVLTDVVLRLDSTFRSRGAIRIECPVLFPRATSYFPSTPSSRTIEKDQLVVMRSNEVTNSSPVEAFQNSPESNTLYPDQLRHHRVFLDRHGAPVFFPNRLVPGFARTAPAFLASGPSICRRFAIQNVQGSADQISNIGTSGTRIQSEVSEHMHAFYDVGIKLAQILEPDVRNGILKAAAAATRSIRTKRSRSASGKLLIHLMRLPTTSTSRSLHRTVASGFCRLYGFHAIALLEAEVVGVTCQAIGSVKSTGQKYTGQRGFEVYWTHGLFLPALLNEVFDIPLSALSSLQREIALILIRGLPKDDLCRRLCQILISAKDDSTHIKRKAEILYDILFFKGDVRSWVRHVQDHVHPFEGSVSIVDLVLRHIEFLDQLLSSSPFRVPTIFTPTFLYDEGTFGKGLAFIATPMENTSKVTTKRIGEPKTGITLKTSDLRSSGIPRGRVGSKQPQLPGMVELINAKDSSITVAETDQVSPRLSIAATTKLISTAVPSGQALHLQGSPVSSCPIGVVASSCRLAVGGCYDFMISQITTYASWSASNALVGVEIAVDLLIDSYFGFNLSMSGGSSVLPPSSSHHPLTVGMRQFADKSLLQTSSINVAGSSGLSGTALTGGGGSNLKRLMERQFPQVFIIVVRSEQQVCATSLRRRLIRQGIQCQRRVDRIVDASQFRRRAKNTSSVAWVVQIREHPPDSIAYKLQYFGDDSNIDTDVVFTDEDDVVNYLNNYFESVRLNTFDND